jgi:hypothetical protein
MPRRLAASATSSITVSHTTARTADRVMSVVSAKSKTFRPRRGVGGVPREEAPRAAHRQRPHIPQRNKGIVDRSLALIRFRGQVS